MPTIKDVAKEAGVSIATVSYVLSNDSRITDKTKEKVNEAIKKLHYLPNLAAQGLKSNRLHIIVVVISSFSGPVYQRILDDMVKVFQDHSYNILISKGKNALNFLESNQVMGAIILDPSVKEELMIKVSKSGSVIADRRHIYTKNAVYGINYIDGYEPSKEVTSLAVNEGFKKIMFVHGDKDTIDDTERFHGYLDSLEENDLKPFAVIEGDFTEKGGYDAIKKYTEENKELPEVIYSSNDEMAIGIIKYLNRKEKIIPEKVKIIGYDDIEISSYIYPSLTTIHVNRDSWATYIAKEVIERIENPLSENLKEEFKSSYEIIRRKSF